MSEAMKISHSNEKAPNRNPLIKELPSGAIFEFSGRMWMKCQQNATVRIGVGGDSIPVICLTDTHGPAFSPNGLLPNERPTRIFDAELVLRVL